VAKGRARAKASGKVDRLGFLLKRSADTGVVLSHLLVHFQPNAPADWIVYPVASFQRSRQYAYQMFILSVLASRRINARDGSHHEPSDANPGVRLLELSDPIHEQRFDSSVRYYRNLLADISRKMRVSRKGLPTSLVEGVRALFQRQSDGNCENPCIGLSAKANRDSFHFWTDEDVPIASDVGQGDVITMELVPASTFSADELDSIVNDVLRYRPWTRRDPATPNTKASAQVQQVLTMLRDQLRDEATSALRGHLCSQDPAEYIPLQLECAHASVARAMARGLDFNARPDVLDLHWRVCDLDILSPPRGPFILCSPSGSGKTTFLRHLQMSLAKTTHTLPFFLDSRELAECQWRGWAELRSELIRPFKHVAPQHILRRVVDNARDTASLVLLVDALDQLDDLTQNCGDLVTRIHSALGAGPVVLSGRPSILRWLTQRHQYSSLRLCKLDHYAQRQYFGDLYDDAARLCRDDSHLLSLPMLASVLRRVLRSGTQDEIPSRWGLYAKYMNYVLFEHARNIRTKDHDAWADSALAGLGQVAYEALTSDPAEIGSVSAAVVARLPKRLRNDLHRLCVSGLADMRIGGHGVGPSLVFVHPSVQEALAAHWISPSPERTRAVLSECWNSKWANVISFLAGKDGSAVVEELIGHVGRPDPLNTRSLLAAKVASESTLPRRVVDRVVARLKRVLDHPLLACEALARLIQIGCSDDRQLAWDIIASGKYVSGWTPLAFEGVLAQLYSPERWRLLFGRLREHGGLSWIQKACLESWVTHLPDDMARSLLEQELTYWEGEPGFIAALMNRVNDSEVAHILGNLVNDYSGRGRCLCLVLGPAMLAGARCGPAASQALLDVVCEPPPNDEVWRLPLKERDRHGYTMSLMESLLLIRPITAEQLTQIKRTWRIGHGPWRVKLLSFAPFVCAQLGDEEFDEIVWNALAMRGASGRASRKMLAYCKHRIADAHIDALRATIARSDPSWKLVAVATTLARPQDTDIADWILEQLWSEDQSVRTASLRRLWHVRARVRPRHVERLQYLLEASSRAHRSDPGNIDHRIEYVEAVESIADVADALPDEYISSVIADLDESESEGRRVSNEARGILGSRMSPDQINATIELLERVEDRRATEHVCALLRSSRISRSDAQRVLNIVASRIDEDSGKSWSYLEEWESRGLLDR